MHDSCCVPLEATMNGMFHPRLKRSRFIFLSKFKSDFGRETFTKLPNWGGVWYQQTKKKWCSSIIVSTRLFGDKFTRNYSTGTDLDACYVRHRGAPLFFFLKFSHLFFRRLRHVLLDPKTFFFLFFLVLKNKTCWPDDKSYDLYI